MQFFSIAVTISWFIFYSLVSMFTFWFTKGEERIITKVYALFGIAIVIFGVILIFGIIGITQAVLHGHI